MSDWRELATEPPSTSWLTAASEDEQWPADDLARVTDELLRLNIEIEQRDDSIGIVGSEHTEPLAEKYRQPVRTTVYRLIRGEQARQQKRYRDEKWSRANGSLPARVIAPDRKR